jgi:hypothetical protein
MPSSLINILRGLPCLAVTGLLSALACTGRNDAADSAALAPRDPLATACSDIAAQFRKLPAGRVEQMTDSFPAFTGERRRFGCVIRAYGPMRGPVTANFFATGLADSLGAQWTRDPSAATDGPNGTVYGLWRGDVLCLFRINWNSSDAPDPGEGQEPQYVGEIGCESLPDHVVPRA